MIDAHIHIQAISIKKISEAKKVGVSAWFVNAAKLKDWEKIEIGSYNYNIFYAEIIFNYKD